MAGNDPKAHRCTAKAKSTGKSCTRPAIPGGVVCRYHGGAAPQVRQKAAARLAALVDPAIGVLAKALASKDERLKLNAAQDVLNRNNLSGKQTVEHSGPDGAPIAHTLKVNIVRYRNDDQPRD